MAHIDLSKTFDVIIVGAGPAGCVLASRLSEQHDKQILLLEAGPDIATPGAEHPDVLDPFCLAATNNAAFHWPGIRARIKTTADGAASQTPSPYIQGYGIGGASNINGMGADRAIPDDYETWRRLGADTWGWDQVLPYFKKLEHDLDFGNAGAVHGNRGPMPARRLPRSRWAPFAAAVGEALQRSGYPFLEDYMADFRDGFSAVPTNCLPARRVSAATAYLTPEVRGRPNLAIISHARVARLCFAGSRACGVVVNLKGRDSVARARQVIVSCGALQSPTLLMRSGIGASDQLAQHGIQVVKHLPGVGANLQNHPSIAITTYLPGEAQQPKDNPWFLQNWARYSSHCPGCEAHDMHLMMFNKGAWHALGQRVGTIVVSVLKSYSKGRVELSSDNPTQEPHVEFNALSDSRDRERLISGLRFVFELLADPGVRKTRREVFFPSASWVARLNRRTSWNRILASTIASILDRGALRRVLLAPSLVHPTRLLHDDRALLDLVERHVGVQYHVCGTCRMGSADQIDAVVDSAARVHGVAGLRVIDASIFPTIPRGYPHFIVLMAAEKLADAVKADWRAELTNRHQPANGTQSVCAHA